MRIFQVDAFTDRPFRGNPAAVCLLDGEADAGWMQSVAAEMNLAETAFVARRPDGFGLRWFTPTVEVDLCGHATLASAHVLWEQGEDQARLRFDTRSGWLVAERVGNSGNDGSDGLRANRIRLDFPADPVVEADPPVGLAEALRAQPVAVGRGRSFYLAELADADTVRSLSPDIAAVERLDLGGVIVTARTGQATGPAPTERTGEDADFVSRFFAPSFGIDEDPVTGAAHCCLAPYWRARLGRDRLLGYQASARGGYVAVAVDGDRVFLTGRAVTVLRGELLA